VPYDKLLTMLRSKLRRQETAVCETKDQLAELEKLIKKG